MQRTYPFVALIVVMVTLPIAAQRAPAPDEYQVKAAFLLRFPEFVEWPPAALAGRASLEVCVAAPESFRDALQNLARGNAVGNLPLTVRSLTDGASIESCHVLFVGTNATPGLLQAARRAPVLTVGDQERFVDQGGIIGLRLVDRRVRFEINAVQAERAGLRLSSQLLRLAVTVRGAIP